MFTDQIENKRDMQLKEQENVCYAYFSTFRWWAVVNEYWDKNKKEAKSTKRFFLQYHKN